MAENLVIESPDFDRIEAGDPRATRDGIFLLWAVLNDEVKKRIRQIREAKNLTDGGVQQVAFTVDQHNYDPGKGRVILSTGATAITISGLAEGTDGRLIVVHVVGSGTITLADDSASSFAENRLLTSTGADVALATDQTAALQYLNSRWRMWAW